MTDLSILIPVYNEMNNLKEFTKKLNLAFNQHNCEFIYINDGSTDGSQEWLEVYCSEDLNKNNVLINHSQNQGKGSAIHSGLKKSIGNYILLQDSDLELDAKDSLEMYKIIKSKKEIECLFGSRYLSGKIKKNQYFLNAIFGKLNSILFNLLFNQSLSDLHCGSKIFTKKVKNIINLTINDFGLEIDIASQIAKQQIPIYEYGISYFPRDKKQGKKITWIDGIKSHYYLFKTRFIDNDFSVRISIIFSSIYMIYVGSFFGMGKGKLMFIVFSMIVGFFIGLNRKILPSSIILFFIFFGSLFSQGNGKIYTVLIGFIIGLYLSKKLSHYVNKKTSNKFLDFFI